MKTLLGICLSAASFFAFGQAPGPLLKGQLLYLPVYSHIWFGDLDAVGKPRMLLVSTLVSIRNVDPAKTITLTSARYYDSAGNRLKEYVNTPVAIKPLATHELYIPKSDSAGGSGANFLISWRSDASVHAPTVEAIHAEVLGTRALAFTTSARQLEATRD